MGKPFHCPICDVNNATEIILKSHSASVHKHQKLYECSKCDSSLLQEKELNTYISSAHVVEIHSVPNLVRNFKSHNESVREGKKSYEHEHCHKGFDEEQNFKSHIESVHEWKKPYECDICGKMKNKTSKAMLNQFMRGRNLINVTFVVKYLMKNKTTKAILNQFMRRRNLMNVIFVKSI